MGKAQLISQKKKSYYPDLQIIQHLSSVHIFLGKLIPDILRSILKSLSYKVGFPGGSDGKGMVTHSSTLA